MMEVKMNHPILKGLEPTGAIIDSKSINGNYVVITKIGIPLIKSTGNSSSSFFYSDKNQYHEMKVKEGYEPDKIVERVRNYVLFVHFIRAFQDAPRYTPSRVSEWCPVAFFDYAEAMHTLSSILTYQKLPNRRALYIVLDECSSYDFLSVEDIELFYQTNLAKRYPEDLQDKLTYKTHSNMMEFYLKKIEQNGNEQAMYQSVLPKLEKIFNGNPCLYTYNVMLKAYNRSGERDKFLNLYADPRFQAVKDDWTYSDYLSFMNTWYGQVEMLSAFGKIAGNRSINSNVGKQTIKSLMRNLNNDFKLAIEIYIQLPENVKSAVCAPLFDEIFKYQPALVLWLKYSISKDKDFMEKLKRNFVVDEASIKLFDKIPQDNEIYFRLTNNLVANGYYKLAQYFYHNRMNLRFDKLIVENEKNGDVKVDLHHYTTNGDYTGSYHPDFCVLVLRDFLDRFEPSSPSPRITIVTGKGKYTTRGKVESFFRERKIEVTIPVHNDGSVILTNFSQYKKSESKYPDDLSEMLAILNAY